MTGERQRLLFWRENLSLAEQMMEDEDLKINDQQERRQILSILPDLSNKRILDMGAGIGRFTQDLADRAERVTALDFKESDIKKNRERNKKYSNISYVCSDIMDWKSPEESFDVIFSSWLLMYLNKPEIPELMEQCHFWLKDNGYLFFRESCLTSCEGLGIGKVTIISLIQSFTGININKKIKNKITFKQIWQVIKSGGKNKSIYYRHPDDYRKLFLKWFTIEKEGFIEVYKKRYHHENQKFWLLKKKLR